MLEVYHLFYETLSTIDMDEDSIFALVFQPITAPHMNASRVNGNIFGLEPRGGTLIFAFAELRWTDSRKDFEMENVMESMYRRFQEILSERGALHPWSYPNYAAGWQNPFESLEMTIRRKLGAVKDSYDPEGHFRTLQGGSFHLDLAFGERCL